MNRKMFFKKSVRRLLQAGCPFLHVVKNCFNSGAGNFYPVVFTLFAAVLHPVKFADSSHFVFYRSAPNCSTLRSCRAIWFVYFRQPTYLYSQVPVWAADTWYLHNHGQCLYLRSAVLSWPAINILYSSPASDTYVTACKDALHPSSIFDHVTSFTRCTV